MGLVRACVRVGVRVWMVLLVKPMMRCLRSDTTVATGKEAVHLAEAAAFPTKCYMHKEQTYIHDKSQLNK